MKRQFILVLALLALACNQNKEHGHAHNPDGSHIGDEAPISDYTIWTDRTELFVEFPALIVGKPSRFAAHFTVLEGHRPVREGSVTVSLVKGEKGIRTSVEAPSSPGIFSPALKPKEAGLQQLLFELSTPQYNDRIVIENVMVYSNEEEARKALGSPGEESSISFLKEQAWKIDFQTEQVVEGEVYDIINTSGIWMPPMGAVKSLAATANGVVDFTQENLTEGIEVKRGQLLMSLSSKGLTSNNLSAEISSAKAKFHQARSAYNRKKELYESKIVPRSEFEKVESNFEIARANYQSLITDVSGKNKQIRAPFDGFIHSIEIVNGEYVEQGTALVSVCKEQSVVLKMELAPYYGIKMENVRNIWYQAKDGQWESFSEEDGKILSITQDVARENPFISVFALINKKVDMPEGSMTQVQIAKGSGKQATVVPESALLEDYGNYSVMVQLSGEGFERRPIGIGKRNGKSVEVLNGLQVGDVVVTTGAYKVKMASMSGSTPAHGHEH